MGAERWLRLKSPKEAEKVKAFLAPLDEWLGIKGKWGCWLEWKGTRLEIAFNVASYLSSVGEFVQREICRRFDVRQIGADSTGWYPDSDWQSTDKRGAPAQYPECSNWIEWAKAYKPEWSGWLPKEQFHIDNKTLFKKMLAEQLAELREVEAFIETKFKELDT